MKDKLFMIINVILSLLLVIPARGVMLLLGIPLVAIGVQFMSGDPSRSNPMKYFPNVNWVLKNMPKIFWLWGNLRDGGMGDMRGNYWFHEKDGHLQHPAWMADKPKWKMWYWFALRNPCNNFSRFTKLMACKVDTHTIKYWGVYECDDDVFGWQFVVAGRYWGYYGVHKVGSYKVYIRMGWKIEPKHADFDWSKDPQRAWKLFTTRFRVSKVEGNTK